MTYENIKSIILTLLVTLSIFLTWSIWTYQPNYEPLVSTKTVPGVFISDKKETKQIVKPDRIYYHHNNSHYGTIHMGEIDRIINEISRWNFERFEEVTSQISNLSSFLYESGHAQLVFPDIVPMEIYKNVFDVKDEDAFELTFDQIVIELDNISKESGYVYFVSTEQQTVYRSRVTASYVANFNEDYFQRVLNNRHFTPYSLQPLGEENRLLVSTEPVTMYAQNYLLDIINTDQFRDALFRNPSFVKRNSTDHGEEYKDSSTLLSVNTETNTVLYVDTRQEKDTTVESSNLLQKSIDFVNSHGGWTDNYHYVGIDQYEQTVLYRLYDTSGFPIFSNNGMSEILQIWGQTGIYQYLRNNFSLERRVESTTTEVELLSGVDTLEILKSREDIEPEFIQDLVPGYEMTRSLGDPLIHLEPSWYYKYKDQWWKLNPGIEGGTGIGLE